MKAVPRRRVLPGGVVLALVPLLAVVAVEAAAQSGSRPNVILVMADDLDVGSLNAALEAGYMPRLSRLADEGTWFTDSFVTLSLCCPSRSTALTGQYPHNHGVVRNSGGSGGFARFDDHSTLATWLRDGGYRTGHVGKYLNGYVDASYVPPGWDDWQALVDPTTYCMYGYTISDNGTPVAYGEGEADYQTDVLASRADDFVREWHEEGAARPFFLSVAPLAPHLESACNRRGVRAAPRHLGSVDLPLPTPPSFNEPRMDDKPHWMRRLPFVDREAMARVYDERIAALRAVDDLIGRLMDRLDSVGALDRTAVLFTSDNGYLLGQHRWRSKVLVYEESIRVPLLLRLPPPAGGQPSRVWHIALNNDLAPTIADLAGVEPGLAVDGRSLLPALGDAPPRWRRRFLVEYPPAGETRGIPPFFAVREGTAAHWERVLYAETLDFAGSRVTDREQYDLVRDPFQQRSLHRDDSPRRVAQRRLLGRWLEQLRVCGGGTCQALEEARPLPLPPAGFERGVASRFISSIGRSEQHKAPELREHPSSRRGRVGAASNPLTGRLRPPCPPIHRRIGSSDRPRRIRRIAGPLAPDANGGRMEVPIGQPDASRRERVQCSCATLFPDSRRGGSECPARAASARTVRRGA